MINQKTLVGDIVKLHFQTVKVFYDYNIDFCCGGKQSLAKACEKQSLNINTVIEKLEAAIKIPSNVPEFDQMPLEKLIQYIKENHHVYVREQIPLISKFLNKIEEVHGKKHPEIEIINLHFKESVKQLSAHMEKEETSLFPFIEQLVALKLDKQFDSLSLKINTANTISDLVKEHENEGERFEEISKLTNKYKAPEGACNTFRAAYQNLDAFEKDLHKHVHLENNILFPKAIKLEQDIRKIN